MRISEQVYETLLNLREAEHCVPWVAPIFFQGHPCFQAYCEMEKAYERLRIRLGVEEEDQDAEEMIDHLLLHGRLLAMEMFHYGRVYQKMQAEEPPDA